MTLPTKALPQVAWIGMRGLSGTLFLRALSSSVLSPSPKILGSIVSIRLTAKTGVGSGALLRDSGLASCGA